MKTINVMAMDLGASNGRSIAAQFDGKKITLQETHRFANNYVFIGDKMYWDILGLFTNLKIGINEYTKMGGKLESMGIDTWGVDFGLLDKSGQLIANTRCYRDPAYSAENMKSAHNAVGGARELFNKTGVASLNFNTIYQLYSMIKNNEAAISVADKMLLIPDLLNYFFTGIAETEYTIASTTQLFDAQTKTWCKQIMQKLGIPEKLLTDVVYPGHVIGNILEAIEDETGQKNLKVISVPGHDTASAVAAVPAGNDDFAFISSGTWSLFGVLSENPLINDAVYSYNISNEGTHDGKFRPLINVMGLWIVQECKRYWDRKGEEIGFGDLVVMAEQAKPFKCFIRPDDFGAAGHMPQRIQQFCKDTNQEIPETKGEIIRCALESIALRYRYVLLALEKAKGKKVSQLNIVGGGIQNKLLCQFAANAVGLPTIAGPVEATATGNLMVQLETLGEISGREQIRDVINNSFDQAMYEPKDQQVWLDAYEKFLKLYEN